MPRPSLPTVVDGVRVVGAEASLLDQLITSIYVVNRTRAADATLAHAISSFRMMCRKGAGRWEKKAYFRMGKDGNGPVVYVPNEAAS